MLLYIMFYMHNVYSQTRVLLCSPGYPQTRYPLPQLPESAIIRIHITMLTKSWVLLFHWSSHKHPPPSQDAVGWGPAEGTGSSIRATGRCGASPADSGFLGHAANTGIVRPGRSLTAPVFRDILTASILGGASLPSLGPIFLVQKRQGLWSQRT